jgi:hypothetical protein
MNRYIIYLFQSISLCVSLFTVGFEFFVSLKLKPICIVSAACRYIKIIIIIMIIKRKKNIIDTTKNKEKED